VSGPLILAIESSCDETGIALVEGGRRIHSNVVASQVALHAPTGGIVPEVAARAHLRWIVPVLDEAWAAAGVGWNDIDAIGVTYGPGLAGSLLVGINFAKALAYVRRKPLVAVNHLEGHLYAAWLLDPAEAERPEPVFPLVALVVSGGHTFLVEMRDHLTYRLLGQTVDDAAGEAFDKVGRLLGLGYPGGPAVMAAAAGATRRDAVFPRAWLGDSYDFSFSGLKTATRRIIARAAPTRGSPTIRGRVSRMGRPPSWRTDSRRRSWTSSRRRRSGPRRPSGRGRSSSAAAWRPTACCASGSRPRRRAAECPSSSRARACAPTTGR